MSQSPAPQAPQAPQAPSQPPGLQPTTPDASAGMVSGWYKPSFDLFEENADWALSNMTHKQHWTRFDPLDRLAIALHSDVGHRGMVVQKIASDLLGSILFRHQFGNDQWDKAGQQWYNYTYFPCVFENGQCYPYMVVYCSAEPVASAVGHVPNWVDYVVQTSGAVIKIDTAMMTGPDIVLAFKSAINLTRPCTNSYIFITRAWGNFEQSEGTVQGPSLGLAVAACILGGVPVAYTGFTRNIIANVQPSGATQGSFDTRLSRRTGEIEQVSKLSAIVEDVKEIGPKIRWAVQSNFPLVLPHSTQFDMSINTLLQNESWAASWMLPNLSKFVFTSAQLDAGYQFEKQGTKLLLATTVNDAILLGLLAAANDTAGLKTDSSTYTNPEALMSVLTAGETNYAKVKEMLEKKRNRRGKKRSSKRTKKTKRSKSDSETKEKKSKKGKRKHKKTKKITKKEETLVDAAVRRLAEIHRTSVPRQHSVPKAAAAPTTPKKSRSRSRAKTPNKQMYVPSMTPVGKAAGSFDDSDDEYEHDAMAAGRYKKRRTRSSSRSSRASSRSSRASSRSSRASSRRSSRGNSRRYIIPGNYLSKLASGRQKNVTWGSNLETVPVQEPRQIRGRTGAKQLRNSRYSKKAIRDIARSMYPTGAVPMITAPAGVMYGPSIPRTPVSYSRRRMSTEDPRTYSQAESRELPKN